jgi:hypothetical protein
VDLVSFGAYLSILRMDLDSNYASRLAATLGSKSSFRKLPRRSVATADIPELCILIAEPPEPLALRLSSNLMMGVARYASIDYMRLT